MRYAALTSVLVIALIAHAAAAQEPPAPPPPPPPPAEVPDEAVEPTTPAEAAPAPAEVTPEPAVTPQPALPTPAEPAPTTPREPGPPITIVVPQDLANPALARDGLPLAGYHDGRVFIRDRNDYFRIFMGGRLHVDSINYFGQGVADSELTPALILRRARLELSGEVMRDWQFLVQGDLSPSSQVSNPNGTVQSYASPAGTDPTAETARYATLQAPSYRAAPGRAFVNYRANGLLNILVGQENVHFSMENRTSSNQISFLERALPIRALAVPLNKDIGAVVWGSLDNKLVSYSVGLTQGEGPNRPNLDNRAMAAGRVYSRPLVNTDLPINKLQVGASALYAMREKGRIAHDLTPMTTQGGYAFWEPTYTDSLGRRIHIIPSGARVGLAAELRVPIDRFELRSEFVYVKDNTREGADGFQRDYTERFGTLEGYGYYVQASYWIWGEPFVNGQPGEQSPPRLALDKAEPAEPPQGIELLLKWEQLNVEYSSADRNGDPDSANVDGDIRLNTISAGASYWASRHLRLSLNYVFNMFPESGPDNGSPEQRAAAPGNRLAEGVNDDARHNANRLHELSARVGVAF